MIEILGEGLDGVDEALVQADVAGARRGEGVEQRQLDQIVALSARGDEAARLGDVHAHLRALIEPAREAGVGVPHQLDHVGIELDRIDRGGALQERAQDIGAAAGAEDQDRRPLEQMIRQRPEREVEIARAARGRRRTR